MELFFADNSALFVRSFHYDGHSCLRTHNQRKCKCMLFVVRKPSAHSHQAEKKLKQNQNPFEKPPFIQFIQSVLPGTKWCGTGDIAATFSDLGKFSRLSTRVKYKI